MDVEKISKELLKDWEQKVSDEYIKRSGARMKSFNCSLDTMYSSFLLYIVYLFFIVILYLLYKMQLPYEMIVWMLLTIVCLFFANKYMHAPHLDILGEPEHPREDLTTRREWQNATPGMGKFVPTHDVFIKYLKHTTIAACLLGVAVIVAPALIYYIKGSLEETELMLLILGIIITIVQNGHIE